MTPDSIIRWLRELESGDREQAACALWEHLFDRLVRYARKIILDTPRRVEDEEDVALSVFKSFCEATKKGRFHDLNDRDSLWKVLLKITARKSIDHIRRFGRKKRAGKGESAIEGGMEQMVSALPDPEFETIASEQYLLLLSLLHDPQLKQIAEGRIEGESNGELARELKCSERTIERKLHLIRRKWEEAGQ
jgi:RNA polymerase sigma factor (sigma-70 family)